MTCFEDERVAAIATVGAARHVAGGIFHRPGRSSPSRAAKHASLSKCGQHSQSIAPSHATKAALRRSPFNRSPRSVCSLLCRSAGSEPL